MISALFDKNFSESMLYFSKPSAKKTAFGWLFFNIFAKN